MVSLEQAATSNAEELLAALGVGPGGLSTTEVAERRSRFGPNAVRSHRARPWAILGRQFRSALLILLAVTATASFFLGSQSDALIIGVILLASVGLGFVNEYRAERTAQALHSGIRHSCTVTRNGRNVEVDVTELVPGDLVTLTLGAIVPADIRLLSVHELACDESALTGESLPVDKGTAPLPPGTALADLACCALMGTVVHSGLGTGVVIATGSRAEFGRLALDLGERQAETDFQVGLRDFSGLLLRVALALTTLIFAANLALARPWIDALMFSLAIAIGITPQLLPAVVSTSLAAGAHRLAERSVLIKRLVCIEDLGDMDLLVTDKTGTLTEGKVSYQAALAPDGSPAPALLALGLLGARELRRSGEVAAGGAGALDAALWEARPADDVDTTSVLDLLPFDHERRLDSVLVLEADGSPLLVTKGAPESVLARCPSPPGHRARDGRAADGGGEPRPGARHPGDAAGFCHRRGRR